MAERAPRGLKSSGRKLWRDVTGRFELDTPELTVLTAACRTADLLDALAADGTVDAMREHRQQAIVLSRLIVSLRLPDDDEAKRPQYRGTRGTYLPRSGYGTLSVVDGG